MANSVLVETVDPSICHVGKASRVFKVSCSFEPPLRRRCPGDVALVRKWRSTGRCGSASSVPRAETTACQYYPWRLWLLVPSQPSKRHLAHHHPPLHSRCPQASSPAWSMLLSEAWRRLVRRTEARFAPRDGLAAKKGRLHSKTWNKDCPLTSHRRKVDAQQNLWGKSSFEMICGCN